MVATVHIVDDDASFRTAVERLLEASGFKVAGYGSGEEILASALPDAPGCIVLDLQMPGISGLELQQRLSEKAPTMPIVFLTGHGNVEASVKAMKAGAEDFLEKPVAADAMLAAINRAIERYEAGRAAYDRILRLRSLVEELTAREAQVFELMIRGKRNKQIAYELGTSERTVKAHRRSIMEKLNVQSLAEAVSIADRLHLFETADR